MFVIIDIYVVGINGCWLYHFSTFYILKIFMIKSKMKRNKNNHGKYQGKQYNRIKLRAGSLKCNKISNQEEKAIGNK